MPLEVNVSDATCASLQADLTLRVLLRTKYDNESRHSKVAIAWARSRAEKFTSAMLENIKQPAAGFSVKMIMIELLGLHNRALICYDIFLEGCEASVQREVEQSLEQPVHMAVRRGKVFFVQKGDENLQQRVIAQYRQFREVDKGPLPYFRDLENPPVYDGGVRLERAEGAGPGPVLDVSPSDEEDEGDGDGDGGLVAHSDSHADQHGSSGEARLTPHEPSSTSSDSSLP
ncbi:hypothetical protein CC79DRAFT_1334078 [Sarocladium strictum]